MMDLEQTLSGVILQKPEAIADLSGIVSAADFNDLRARRIFTLASEAFRNEQPFDLVLAAEKMPKHSAWLAEATDVIPINHREYALEIRNKAKMRRLATGLNALSSQKFNQADDLLFEVEKLYRAETGPNNAKNGDIKAVLDRTFQIIERNRSAGRPHGVSTGFDFLERRLVRFVPGHMWVVAGFTSAGKSALLVELLARLAGSARVLVVSTEMTEEQLSARMISRETGIHNQRILSGQLTRDEYEMVCECRAEIAATRDLIVNDSTIEISQIEGLVTREAMRRELDVVFIDYVQQLRAKGIPYKDLGRELAERIQQLAKRANTCIVCFSQVSNQVGRGEVDQFEAKGAGEWGACADVGIRLRRKSKDQHALCFDMQKGRHFGIFQQDLEFYANHTRIREAQK